MNSLEDFCVGKRVREEQAYYTIHWSPLCPAEIYALIRSAPSMAGIYELYYREPSGILKQISFSMAWYGGLRENLRRDIDPSLLDDAPVQQALVAANKCFYRFSLCESIRDMEDLCFFFSSKRPPDRSKPPGHSGRYRKIYVRELDSGKLVTL